MPAAAMIPTGPTVCWQAKAEELLELPVPLAPEPVAVLVWRVVPDCVSVLVLSLETVWVAVPVVSEAPDPLPVTVEMADVMVEPALSVKVEKIVETSEPAPAAPPVMVEMADVIVDPALSVKVEKTVETSEPAPPATSENTVEMAEVIVEPALSVKVEKAVEIAEEAPEAALEAPPAPPASPAVTVVVGEAVADCIRIMVSKNTSNKNHHN